MQFRLRRPTSAGERALRAHPPSKGVPAVQEPAVRLTYFDDALEAAPDVLLP